MSLFLKNGVCISWPPFGYYISFAPRESHIEAFVDTTRRSYVQFCNLFGELHGHLQLISSFERRDFKVRGKLL